MSKWILFSLIVAVGCGGDDGGSVDAPVVPTTITVTGTASEIGISGRTPVAGVVIGAYEEGGTTPVAMATTDAQGNYTLTITTTGAPLDGYLLGKHAPHKDTYLYPAGPLIADISNATILLLTQSTFEAAATIAQAQQLDGMGWIGVQVYDGANAPVAGVTVSSSPQGTVRYNGSNGLPSSSAMMTGADGVAYIFNVAPGTVTLSATGGGHTFRSHPVNARADQVTTTLIQP